MISQQAGFPQLMFFDASQERSIPSDENGHSKFGEGTNKPKVLVVDDELLIAETVVEILGQAGFDATAVSSAVEAIEMAKASAPDLVLSDVIMPAMSGVDIGIKIREIAPQCKVILFSGQAATSDLVESARHQGYQFDVLAKPIRPEALIGIVRKQLGLR